MDLNTDLNEVVEKIGKEIIDYSNEKAPIVDFNVKTIKTIDDKLFQIEIKVSPLSMKNESYSLMREFLNELEVIKKEYISIDEIIKKYKKWLLIE